MRSNIRTRLPGEVVDHLDVLPREDLRAKLGALLDTSVAEGFDVATEAVRKLVVRGGAFSAGHL